MDGIKPLSERSSRTCCSITEKPTLKQKGFSTGVAALMGRMLRDSALLLSGLHGWKKRKKTSDRQAVEHMEGGPVDKSEGVVKHTEDRVAEDHRKANHQRRDEDHHHAKQSRRLSRLNYLSQQPRHHLHSWGRGTCA